MIVIDNFNQVLSQIESERGIGRDVIISAIEQALVSACRKKIGEEADLYATLDSLTGEAHVYRRKTVVDSVEDDELEISVKDAKEFDKKAKAGGTVEWEVTPDDFGRIAAQTAKQVIIQRIREAEKNAIHDEFEKKIGTIITGTVQRIENQNYLFNLGRVEAVLFPRDQIQGEKFQANEKVRLYVAGVEQNNRGAFIHITRTHPGFLKALFEQEIPEIQDGIIEVMSVSREPGKRAKVAVKTNNPTIGAVGTCVGHMGSRIQSIIKELGFEKIDVLEWHEDPVHFISNALKPAKISRVIITNDEEREAIVVVPNDQLSLAIGKNGINVRLSVKLTSWRLDIMSETDFAEKQGELLDGKTLSIVEKIQLEKERLAAEEAENDEDDTPVIPKLVVEDDEDDASFTAAELAEALNMPTTDLIEEAKGFGVTIENEDTALNPDDVEKIKENIRG